MLRNLANFVISGIIIHAIATLGIAQVFDFQIQPGLEPEKSSLEITIEAVGIDTDTDSSPISGTVQLELDSPSSPFSQARILDLTLIMDEGLDFRMGPLNLIRGSSAPGDLMAVMLSPGPSAAVLDGVFSQENNLFGVDGEIVLSVLDDPFDLATLDPLSGDINDVQISQQDGELSLGIDLDLVFEAVLEDIPVLGTVPIVISLNGSINAVSNASLPGDLDGNGVIQAADINSLTNAILAGDFDPRHDLNDDGQVNGDDRTFWVEEIANTFFGDANLDGEFNSGDLVFAFARAEYEDEISENSTWEDGDWSGDREFDSSDFVVAFSHGGFEVGPRPIAVPESTSTRIAFLGLLFGFLIGRNRSSR